MTDEEKNKLNILIAEKFLGFKWWVSSATERRGLFKSVEHRNWFKELAKGDEPLCSGWDADVQDYVSDPLALQLVKDELMKRGEDNLLVTIALVSSKEVHVRIQDFKSSKEIRTYKATAETEGESLCLAVKKLLEAL